MGQYLLHISEGLKVSLYLPMSKLSSTRTRDPADLLRVLQLKQRPNFVQEVVY
uniref:Uncharacterized protein n=1 Tax=Hyaloperonospora arabidopsidis (strain Emoy2) TaxID=559515 RepID=M4BS83_HYAAE